jgi:alanyl-tRNA synthetase
MQALARRLTNEAGRVAILVTDAGGAGRVIVGSTAAEVPAVEVLRAMTPLFDGKGGGNPSVATASGTGGEALRAALEAGRAKARALAGTPPGA